MNRYILSSIAQIRKCLQSFLNEEFKALNLRSSELFFMQILYNGGDKAQIEISRTMECDKAYIHRMVLKLLDKKLIKFNENEQDHIKNNKLTLTEKGKKISSKFTSIIEKWNKNLIKGISKDELNTVNIVIQKLLKNAYDYKKMELKNV